jgi:hypothetical protein
MSVVSSTKNATTRLQRPRRLSCSRNSAVARAIAAGPVKWVWLKPLSKPMVAMAGTASQTTTVRLRRSRSWVARHTSAPDATMMAADQGKVPKPMRLMA